MLLLIDNYDSFTYNIVHAFEELGQEVVVKRTCESLSECHPDYLVPDYLVIGPGPGFPEHSEISHYFLHHTSKTIPILGICLGHQLIGVHFGAKVTHAKSVMHGKVSPITHDSSHLFTGIPNNFSVARYHSLILDPISLPEDLCINAQTAENEVMAISHKTRPIYGVQFHPESIASDYGHILLSNFLSTVAKIASYPPPDKQASCFLIEGVSWRFL